jgi:conjugal transfer pilus assembly protein TraE
MAGRLNLMVTLVFGLLITNILMGSLAWYGCMHQRVEITPFFGSSGYLNSETSVDEHYLRLMSENFIYSRLNVTPETVVANHKRLLSFVDASQYALFSGALHKEATVIQSRRISSHMEITGITADSHALSCVVTGVLKRYVGLRALPDELVTYTLRYRYAQGRLLIKSFTHQQEQHHG